MVRVFCKIRKSALACLGMGLKTPPTSSRKTILWLSVLGKTASFQSCGLWLMQNYRVEQDLEGSSDLDSFQGQSLGCIPCSGYASLSSSHPSSILPGPQGSTVPRWNDGHQEGLISVAQRLHSMGSLYCCALVSPAVVCRGSSFTATLSYTSLIFTVAKLGEVALKSASGSSVPRFSSSGIQYRNK